MEPAKRQKLIPWEECEKVHMAFKFAYIGFNYDGVASQKNTQNTVEEWLFKALVGLKLVEDRKSCNYSLCGRTDKGVTALGNVFSVTIRSRGNLSANPFQYVKMINSRLPGDIRILSSLLVPHYFDARFSCLYREYRYYFLLKNKNLPLMAQACQSFIGVHDFRNFCKDDTEKKKSTERRILTCKIDQRGEVGIITVVGYSFLWHQVRCMVAVLFKIGEGVEDVSIVGRMLEHRGQKPQYNIASEVGLVLHDCGFETVAFVSEDDGTLRKPLCEIEEDLIIKLQVVKSLTESFGLVEASDKKAKKIQLKD